VATNGTQRESNDMEKWLTDHSSTSNFKETGKCANFPRLLTHRWKFQSLGHKGESKHNLLTSRKFLPFMRDQKVTEVAKETNKDSFHYLDSLLLMYRSKVSKELKKQSNLAPVFTNWNRTSARGCTYRSTAAKAKKKRFPRERETPAQKKRKKEV
jgi:hypothetical protein